MGVCDRCRSVAPDDARYCPTCGAPLDGPRLRAEERKVVTALFVDLVGFTGRAERMDVEDVRALLAPYHALVRRELEQRGGTLEKFVGDGVMAVFGAPAAHEDDPERAVRAALAIREAAATATRDDPSLDLHVRVGICTGETLVAVDAVPAHGEAFASGDVINTAARLQAAAPGDGILVGLETYRATTPAIDYEPFEPVSAKGKAMPVDCWLVRRARAQVADLRRADLTRLVDRTLELPRLVEAFEHTVRDRVPHAVTLIGVPGIGKTRLVAELAEHTDRMPELIRWRLGRALPYGEPAPFSALAQIVRAEAGILDSDPAEIAASKLRTVVGETIADPAERGWIEDHLRPIAGVEAERGLVGDRRAEAFAAWRRFLEHLGRQRPTVLAFEDLHWADDSLLDFIEHVAAWASDAALLLVCTARPELLDRRPVWLSAGDADRLPIEPLSSAETAELIDAMSAASGLDASTRSLLLAQAEGNPLYAHEYVRLVGELSAAPAPESSLSPMPVPATVRGIIAARLDALSGEQKATLQDAAVVGRMVWPGAVAHVAGRSRWAVEETLGRLERRRLLRRRPDSTVEGEYEYAFEHSLIREVAYAGIVRADRSHKHARAADWLASAPGARAARIDAIANHLSTAHDYAAAAGGQTEELRAAASAALREAAARARRLHSYRTAARLYARGLELSTGREPDHPRLVLDCGIAKAMADEPAEGLLQRAAAELLERGDTVGAAEAESTLGWLASLRGQAATARAHDREALRLCRSAAPSPRKALILIRAGAHEVFLAEQRTETLELLREATEIARRERTPELEAEALQFIGLARLDGGDADGIQDLVRALEIGSALESPVSLSCYGNLADIRTDLGELAEAAELRAAGLRAGERFGMPAQARRFPAGMVADRWYSGDWDGAVAGADAHLAGGESRSQHWIDVDVHIGRGRVRLLRGDLAGAAADADDALRLSRRSAEPFGLFPALAFHARVAAATGGEPAGSVGEYLELLSRAQPFWAGRSLPDTVGVVARAGRVHELRDLLDRARLQSAWFAAAEAELDGDHARAADRYAEIGSQPDEAAARLRAARAAESGGRGDEARIQRERATAFFDRVGVPVATSG